MKSKKQYISLDNAIAISSYGESFSVGEKVKHEDGSAGEAVIESFEVLKKSNEIRVHTNKGFASLDFLVKIK